MTVTAPAASADLRPEASMFEALASPVRIGAVTLAVRDMGRVAAFYRSVVGLEVQAEGDGGVTLGSTGEALIHLVAAPAATPDDAAEPGLFHTAFLLPSRAALAVWLRRAARNGLRLQGASDHQVSEALYFADPEGNGIEVYADRPRRAWRRTGSTYAMTTLRLDLDALLAEAPPGDAVPPIRVGHIHLRTSDLQAARAFYEGRLGMAVTHARPGALWFGYGGYHHHVAANVWSADGAARTRSPDRLGLRGYELVADASDPAGRLLLDARPDADPAGIAITTVAARPASAAPPS